MLIGFPRHTAPARCAGQEAALEQIRLVYILKRDRFLVYRRGKGLQSDGAAAVKLDYAAQHPAIQRVKSKLINLKARQRRIRYLAGYDAVRSDLCEIAHTAQQSVCNSGCAA